MKKLNFVIAIIIALVATPVYAASIIDGDFTTWSFGAIGSATVSREASDGNPGARLKITTVSGPTVWGTAIKTDFSTNIPLSGTPFELRLDVLSGPGAFGEGQLILLLVEQNSNIYGVNLDRTGFPLNWDTLSFSGSFIESSFYLLSGSGPAIPDFNGGTDTFFGFAGANTISGTLTQYYDNFNLQIVPPAKDLLYTPVTPCRVVDTRKAGGAISVGGIRSYNVRGAVASQGGNPAGCPSPKGEPRAVHVNVTSVPLGNGWITAYPYNSTAPTASMVNYRSDAQNVANSGTIKTCFNCAKDINIKSGVGKTHVVIDVLGYYYKKP